ncbi:putative rRNA maturation factor [Rhizobium sp. SG_E_25_P2]|uniref:rRNA maturation RNase YbeY n=1 Tax=Rhizobium sp. SG_E_25_P2 TaxID=2879942 RepID=UPI0024751EA0|nr:rRNA maturation RNase YbeY [Rhizobium sp. SG_E_25_P2]MDH6265046.1 putative rRNA maturation factor [Rhizobium sp. SG_E_25_P2]
MSDRLDIQLSLEEGDWQSEDVLEAFVRRVLEHAATHLAEKERQPFPKQPVEVSLVFTNDAAIREINAEWREQDKPTNVLSFPAFPLAPGGKPGPMLGDIILAEETLRREALDLGVAFEDHLTHLLVHGFLHLFGYDHMTEEEAAVMEGLEIRILAELGLENPYRDDDRN